MTVGELGESGVLGRVLARLGHAENALIGPGDDCAVLRTTGDTVVTSDTMIEGPDFRTAWHDGRDLGWKLAATNLSDVAAMGARPTALTVALAVPRATPVSFLEDIATGLDAACHALAPGCGVVGGDLGTAPVVVAAVTALGDLEGRSPVLRSGAEPGNVLAYTGNLGLAGLGLSLLFARAADEDGVALPGALDALHAEFAVPLAAQLAPEAPIRHGVAAAVAGASAMMDVSDSLSIDAARMARASGVVIELDSVLLAREFGTQRVVDVPVSAMLTGGEDHGLLAAFPPGAALPEGFRVVGRVLDRPDPDGTPLFLDGAPLEPSGWDPYVVRWPGS